MTDQQARALDLKRTKERHNTLGYDWLSLHDERRKKRRNISVQIAITKKQRKITASPFF